MNGPIRHMATAIFLIFALLAGAVTYQQLIVGPDYRDDPRNARLIAGRANGPRPMRLPRCLEWRFDGVSRPARQEKEALDEGYSLN